MWNMHDRTTEEQARTNRGRSNNGTIAQVEDTSPLDDAWDVAIGLAGSGVVYDIARPYQRTGGSSECSHGGHDRCHLRCGWGMRNEI